MEGTTGTMARQAARPAAGRPVAVYRRRPVKRRRSRMAAVLATLLPAALLFGVLIFTREANGAYALPVGSRGLSAQAEEALEQLEALRRAYPGLEALLDDPTAWPESYIKLAASSADAIPFVLAYPQRQNLPVQGVGDSWSAADGFPALYQWDLRWGYAPYAGGVIGLDGCGPVCLSMAALWLTGDTAWDPPTVARLAESGGHAQPGVGTAWSLMTEGAAALGLLGRELPLDENTILQALRAGQPVICSMRPGDFTTTGHFIVLHGVGSQGEIWLRDPNSPLRSASAWTYAQLAPQIKNLWAFSLA